MSQKAIVLYLHAHQPYRLRHYTIFDTSKAHNYFETEHDASYDNRKIIEKVANKSYLPTNRLLFGRVLGATSGMGSECPA
jgi:alpha-amylase